MSLRSYRCAWARGIQAQFLFFLFLAIAGSAHAVSADELSWPAFPTPANAKVSWVAQNMRYNNVPTQIRMMELAEHPSVVISFYQKLWTLNGAKVTVMELKPWVVLSQTRGPFHFTMETRAVKGGSESVLTVSRLPEMIEQAKRAKASGLEMKKLGLGFPMMSGSKVDMDMESFDEGKQGRMIMHKNTFTIEDNALFLREQLLLQGWKRNQDKQNKDGLSRVLIFARDHQELTLTISRRESQTEIFSNQTEVN